ncbi:MAG: hypothetical protein L3J10_01040 [Sulfurimonas sp.]|nr:hypothetical protein [Sulfurimonas sp.]
MCKKDMSFSVICRLISSCAYIRIIWYYIFMKIETQYSYETKWTLTNELDLLKVIEEEIGDADTKGILLYIKEAIKTGKIIAVGTCRFKEKRAGK